MIEAEVLLDNLLAGGDRYLDGSLYHGTDPLVHRLLDRQLNQLDDLGMLREKKVNLKASLYGRKERIKREREGEKER